MTVQTEVPRLSTQQLGNVKEAHLATYVLPVLEYGEGLDDKNREFLWCWWMDGV